MCSPENTGIVNALSGLKLKQISPRVLEGLVMLLRSVDSLSPHTCHNAMAIVRY